MVRATGDDSIRQRLYKLWVDNPYITAKKACIELGLNYQTQGHMVNVRLSEFRSYHKLGSLQKPHNLPKHREFTWEGVVRPDGLPVEWARRGWRVVENRNDMWVFRDPDGRGAVHWYAGGLVRLFLKGELQLAKAKELFGRAFSGVLPEDLFIKCLDARLKETYRKWTFELGAPVPRFDIRQFERSHGIRIFADGSNPTAFHVGESTPFWIEKLDSAMDKMAGNQEQFATEIQSHLDLIKDWQKESTLFREWLQSMLAQNKTALKEYDHKTDHGIV